LRLIKKYPNRKLYDTEDNRYVSLGSIAFLVIAGEEVRVVDNTNGEDITTLVLSQILREQERKGSFLPQALLSALIRSGAGGLNNLKDSFQASLSALQALEDEVRESIDTMAQRGEISMTEAQELREELLRAARRRQIAMEERILQEIEASLTRLGMPTRSDLKRLRSRLGEIETKLDSLMRDRA
jgi:polyhydroxyalkanoate synthesis repressor PhaR